MACSLSGSYEKNGEIMQQFSQPKLACVAFKGLKIGHDI
jgi:hypothetical protein